MSVSIKQSRTAFIAFSCTTLAWTVGVIAWGAFVRLSGSGAGCGAHWPLCDGQIVPHSLFYERMVEFIHRATSGLALILVIAQYIWSRRINAPLTSRIAFFSVLLILSEAAIGAGLVLFELVASDDSVTRAVVIALHLVNSLLLLGTLCLVPWSFHRDLARRRREPLSRPVWGLTLLITALLVGATGAITALGDTLFPSMSVYQGFREDFAYGSHFLIRLRIIHPFLAVFFSLAVFFYVGKTLQRQNARRERLIATALLAVVLLQIVLGVANVVLLAPAWLQILHLLGADASWMALVLLLAEEHFEPLPGSIRVSSSGNEVRKAA